MKTLVILPTYNERANLEGAIAAIFAHCPNVEVLVVDDASPDGTGEVAQNLSRVDHRIHVLNRQAKEGLGRAYLAGFDWGLGKGFEYLVEMDADFSHRAEDLPSLLQAATNADLVLGSRWVRGGAVVNWPVSRLMLSRLGNLYARTMLKSRIQDLTAGFRVIRASALNQIDLKTIAAQGYSFQVELAWRFEVAGLRVVEVPITFVERENGVSKMSSAIVREALWLITRWGILGR
ncbi:MAG: polyprenol monophosphomannose synthase [Microbacteriaceae bacterium]